MTEEQDQFEQWAILELMGHRRLAGYVREVEIAGGSFLRLDVHGEDGEQVATQFYSPSSVYCITPTDETTARRVASQSRPAPVHLWQPPPQPAAIPRGFSDDDDREPGF